MTGLVDALRALTTTSGGMVQLMPVRLSEIAALAYGVGLGDPLAIATMNALLSSPAMHDDRDQRGECAGCHLPYDRDTCTIVAVLPSIPNPTGGINVVVCHTCASESAEVAAVVNRAIKVLWPKARQVSVTHRDGGRA